MVQLTLSFALLVRFRWTKLRTALSDILRQRPSPSRRGVNANADESGACGQFLRLLIGHFVNEDQCFLTNFLYVGVNGTRARL